MTVVTTCTIDQAPRDTAITDSYEYDAFGNKFTVSGTTPNNYLYRGEQYDPDLGLYYLRARYYNPLTGRFLSRDPEDGTPYDPASLHKYLYARGDPVNASDPEGRAATIETVFSTAEISSPLEAGAGWVGRTVSVFLCASAEFITDATLGWPSNLASPVGVPLWSLKALTILCKAQGY
jgi:RHS repeat-associated protein